MPSNKPLESYREEFPITRLGAFLNHAGVSPLCGRAQDAIRQWIGENDRGMCARYDTWAGRIEDVRGAAARLIGASAREVAFVKNTSHGLNLVAHGLTWKNGDNIVSYNREFPANIYPWMSLQSEGVELRLVADRDARIRIEDIGKAIDIRTRLLSISSVEFESGFRNDLHALGEMCREKGILFCVDGIQSLGALQMDVKKFRIDFLSADAHKWLLGPEGIGIFYVRADLIEKMKPVCIGWHSVKDPLHFLPYHYELKDDATRFEEGSHNLMGICALGGCLSLFEEVGMDRIEARIIELTDQLAGGLARRGWKLLTPRGEGEKSGIVTFSGNVDPVKKVAELAARNIYICSRQGYLRVSPHFYNTSDEMDRCLEMLGSNPVD